MAKITYIVHDGTEHKVEVKTGLSVMEGAIRNNVPGIDADCGGACACATCHVYIESPWFEKLPAMADNEDSMLELASERRPNSRLSCQVKVTAELDGMEVHTPEGQH